MEESSNTYFFYIYLVTVAGDEAYVWLGLWVQGT
jgi:hypothetical protein